MDPKVVNMEGLIPVSVATSSDEIITSAEVAFLKHLLSDALKFNSLALKTDEVKYRVEENKTRSSIQI